MADRMGWSKKVAVLGMLVVLFCCWSVQGAETAEYVLNSGDTIRVTVYRNPDLTTEARISESGAISFPLLSQVPVATLTISQAEKVIADRLREGGFVKEPWVTLLPLRIRGSQVAVLGQVNRPGRYPLELANTHISDILATAGGIATSGADEVVLTGLRGGQQIRKTIDVKALFVEGTAADERVVSGDTLYVDRAPVFYIHGEVQHPGAFRLERNMTVMQALATGGGVTARGTERGLLIYRRGADGKMAEFEPRPEDILLANDVIKVRESLF